MDAQGDLTHRCEHPTRGKSLFAARVKFESRVRSSGQVFFRSVFFVYVLMTVTVAASTMTSVRNITNDNTFFPARSDREMTFAGNSILNEIVPIPFSFSLFMIFVNGLSGAIEE